MTDEMKKRLADDIRMMQRMRSCPEDKEPDAEQEISEMLSEIAENIYDSAVLLGRIQEMIDAEKWTFAMKERSYK